MRVMSAYSVVIPGITFSEASPNRRQSSFDIAGCTSARIPARTPTTEFIDSLPNRPGRPPPSVRITS